MSARHKAIRGEEEYLHLFLTLAIIDVTGQLNAPVTLYPDKVPPDAHLILRLVGPGTGLGVLEQRHTVTELENEPGPLGCTARPTNWYRI
jgi:hypothetical protein